MFERYTEKARRTIFFARYESSQFGSPCIETEHLLLGLLREDKALAHRFLGTTSSESIRKQIEARVLRGNEVIPTSVDLPLSAECARVLAYGAEEAERLKHKHIGTDHLLLGLLREEKGLAAAILREHGLQLEHIRAKSSGRGALPELVRNTLAAYLGAQQRESRVTVLISPRVGSRSPDVGVYDGESAEPAPGVPPFVCIEVLSQDDRFAELIDRIDDYLAMGVRYVWVLDPASRRAYVATAESGFQEFKGQVLRTENPVLEVPLAAIFT